MQNLRRTHPTLFSSLVAIRAFNIVLGIILITLPDLYFTATQGPKAISQSTNVLFGALVAAPGLALLPALIKKWQYSIIQKILIFDMAIWVFFTLSSLGTAALGSPRGLIGGVISAYFAFHRFNLIGEPPVNPAVQLGNEIRQHERKSGL